MLEVNEAAEIIHAVAHQDANIIFGAVIDDEMGDDVRDRHRGRLRPLDDGPRGAAPARSGRDGGPATGEVPIADVFASDDDDDDDLDLGDDDFDVPSFLK
ncbi:MAG: hypothetical protein R2695_16055 [Acidimicrobiales bacterium]